MLQRFDLMPMAMTKLQRPISAYLRENIHYTFSGFNFTPTFLDLLLEVGVDRIMFSADHPYASMVQARAFLDKLPVSTTDRERSKLAWQCGTPVCTLNDGCPLGL